MSLSLSLKQSFASQSALLDSFVSLNIRRQTDRYPSKVSMRRFPHQRFYLNLRLSASVKSENIQPAIIQVKAAKEKASFTGLCSFLSFSISASLRKRLRLRPLEQASRAPAARVRCSSPKLSVRCVVVYRALVEVRALGAGKLHIAFYQIITITAYFPH